MVASNPYKDHSRTSENPHTSAILTALATQATVSVLPLWGPLLVQRLPKRETQVSQYKGIGPLEPQCDHIRKRRSNFNFKSARGRK